MPTTVRKMEVVFNPTPEQERGGVVSFVAWDSDRFHAALRSVVRARESEVIDRIDVKPDGIKVYFGTKP